MPFSSFSVVFLEAVALIAIPDTNPSLRYPNISNITLNDLLLYLEPGCDEGGNLLEA